MARRFDFEALRDAVLRFARRAGDGVRDSHRRHRQKNDDDVAAIREQDQALGHHVDGVAARTPPRPASPIVEGRDLPGGATTWTSHVDGATLRIGNDANQVDHAFRHTAELGLVNETVAQCVLTHYRVHGPIALRQGQRYVGSVDLDGVGLEYTAFRVDGDSINIGRIIVP